MPREEPEPHSTGPRDGQRADAVLELSILAGGLLILARILLRGLWHPPVPWALPPLVVAALLALRVGRAERRGEAGHGLPGRRMAGSRSPDLVLAACFLLGVALFPSSTQSLGPDGAVYLEQVRGVVLHARLDTHLGIELGNTLLQAPFFVLGHVVALAVSALWGQATPDGSDVVYQNALRLGGAVYGLVAAAMAWLVCRRFFPPTFAAVCVGGTWLSSTLVHYSVAEPGMAHAGATALASLLLLLWLRARESPARLGRWVAVAFVGGLLVSTQRYDLYLLLPAVLTGASHLAVSWRAGDAGTRRRAALAVAALAGAFALALVPLILVSFAFPGGFLLAPEVLRTTMLGDWARPHVGEVLFSSNRGLFAWTPVALLGTLGLVVLARRERRIGVTLLATLALGVVVLGSNPTWWAGWSFGARRFTEAFAILALGFCALAAAALRRPRLLGAVALLGLVAVNLSLSGQYRRGSLAPEGTISFTRGMQGVVADVYALAGHPASWPASWLFAARYGLEPDRFDDLYGQIPRRRWMVRLGTDEDSAVLGHGWSRPYGESPEVRRWAQGPDATLLFALSAPVDRLLALHAAAARHPRGLGQGLAVEVNGQPAGRLVLPPATGRVGLVTPAALWSEGLNEVRFRPEWVLSRPEAMETGQPPYAAWSAATVLVEPLDDAEPEG